MPKKKQITTNSQIAAPVASTMPTENFATPDVDIHTHATRAYWKKTMEHICNFSNLPAHSIYDWQNLINTYHQFEACLNANQKIANPTNVYLFCGYTVYNYLFLIIGSKIITPPEEYAVELRLQNLVLKMHNMMDTGITKGHKGLIFKRILEHNIATDAVNKSTKTYEEAYARPLTPTLIQEYIAVLLTMDLDNDLDLNDFYSLDNMNNRSGQNTADKTHKSIIKQFIEALKAKQQHQQLQNTPPSNVNMLYISLQDLICEIEHQINIGTPKSHLPLNELKDLYRRFESSLETHKQRKDSDSALCYGVYIYKRLSIYSRMDKLAIIPTTLEPKNNIKNEIFLHKMRDTLDAGVSKRHLGLIAERISEHCYSKISFMSARALSTVALRLLSDILLTANIDHKELIECFNINEGLRSLVMELQAAPTALPVSTLQQNNEVETAQAEQAAADLLRDEAKQQAKLAAKEEKRKAKADNQKSKDLAKAELKRQTACRLLEVEKFMVAEHAARTTIMDSCQSAMKLYAKEEHKARYIAMEKEYKAKYIAEIAMKEELSSAESNIRADIERDFLEASDDLMSVRSRLRELPIRVIRHDPYSMVSSQVILTKKPM